MTNPGIRILLVEDNPGDARLVEEMLASSPIQAGFTIRHVETLGDAVQSLGASPCDLVLLDLCLPDSTALDSVNRIMAAAPKVPIVVMSGLNDEEMALQAVQQGAQDYLVKGLENSVLLTRSLRYAIERKRTERDKEEIRDFLNSVVENLPNMIVVKDARDLGYVRVNQAAVELLGYAREELIGKHDQDLLLPQEAEYSSAMDRKVLQENVMADIPIEPVATRHRGTRLLHTRKIPITGRDGKPVYILCISEDITEQVEADTRARKLSSAVEQVPDSIFIANREGIIEYVNPAFEKITGYDSRDVLGKTPHILKSGEMSQAFYRRLWETILGGDVFHDVFINRRKDGELYHEEITISPLRDSSARVTHFISSGRDITERRHAEEALKKAYDELEQHIAERTIDLQRAKEEAETANAAKSDFLSRMSHELRTPMNAILGFSQLLTLDEHEPLSEVQQQKVGEILKAGNHLLDLINEVLDLATIESGRSRLIMEPLLTRSVLVECLALIEPMARQREIELNHHICSDDQCLVHADRTRFRQVLINLMSNAVKYTQQGGTVTLACRLTGDDTVEISVADNGPGIPLEQQHLLFEPFERLNAGSDIEGTGIGLTVTKRLVELMNGEIRFESEVGKGSVFRVILKEARGDWKEESAQGCSSVAVDNQEPAKRSGYTLLYIEDNAANLKLVEEIVVSARPDIRFIGAHTPELGMDLATAYLPDLILLDINLPGMNGFELLGWLQGQELLKNIRVAAVSAHAMPKDIRRAQEAGFDDYLTKPLDLKQFRAVIDRFLPIAEA